MGKKERLSAVEQSTKKIIFSIIVVLVLIGIGLLIFYTRGQSPTPSSQGTQSSVELTVPELESLTKRLTEVGVKMYGSYICSACLAQIKMFGGHEGSFRNISYIECHPRGPNPQTDLCLARNINKTPTWILEKDDREVKRLEGLQTLDALAEFAGIPLRVAN